MKSPSPSGGKHYYLRRSFGFRNPVVSDVIKSQRDSLFTKGTKSVPVGATTLRSVLDWDSLGKRTCARDAVPWAQCGERRELTVIVVRSVAPALWWWEALTVVPALGPVPGSRPARLSTWSPSALWILALPRFSLPEVQVPELVGARGFDVGGWLGSLAPQTVS